MDSTDEFEHYGFWKQSLYLLQGLKMIILCLWNKFLEKAPKPMPVFCKHPLKEKPAQYGAEFHGLIERGEAEKLLCEAGEGAYLVRSSTRGESAYTLCIYFEGKVMNYKLYFDGMHFVGEKRFNFN